MTTEFTVLLPVHRPPDLLQFSVKSVLSQDFSSFELWILCDGAPKDTVLASHELAASDPRVRVFDFPKGARHGEAYRHELLMSATGPLVAYIADDDIWFPNHLTEMKRLLSEVDFGNLLQPFIHEDKLQVHFGHLENSACVAKMMKGEYNFFGPTTAGHTLSAYKNLREGWTPAPSNIPTDLFMWQKFLSALPALKVGTQMSVTSLHFPTCLRKLFSMQERKIEMETWYNKVVSPSERENIIKSVFKITAETAYLYQNDLPQLSQQLYDFQKEKNALANKNQALFKKLSEIDQSISWKLTRPLRWGNKIINHLIRAF